MGGFGVVGRRLGEVRKHIRKHGNLFPNAFAFTHLLSGAPGF